MRTQTRLGSFLLSLAILIAPAVAHAGGGASASATVSIKADVKGSAHHRAAAGDALVAKGDLEAALVAYGEGFAATRDAAFIYAMAHCHKGLGHAAEAKAMFEMYLASSSDASLKYRAEAEAELTTSAKGAAGKAAKLAGKAAKATKKLVVSVAEGVYTAAKVSVAAKMKAEARAEAEAADAAYASGKYADAAKGYLEAYAKTQQAIALYAAAQAHAQAGNAIEARALLMGYLVTRPKAWAKEATSLLLAVGGNAKAAAAVAVKAKVSAKAKADAGKGDKAFKAGRYAAAADAYAAAYAKTSDAALLYAKGMAQYYAGRTAEAAATLRAYLDAGGKLEFKAQAEATIRASGGTV